MATEIVVVYSPNKKCNKHIATLINLYILQFWWSFDFITKIDKQNPVPHVMLKMKKWKIFSIYWLAANTHNYALHLADRKCECTYIHMYMSMNVYVCVCKKAFRYNRKLTQITKSFVGRPFNYAEICMCLYACTCRSDKVYNIHAYIHVNVVTHIAFLSIDVHISSFDASTIYYYRARVVVEVIVVVIATCQ